MKPTSVIFLIFSVILIAGGIGTMYIAANIAEKEGIELLEEIPRDENENNPTVHTYDFETDDVSRITIKAGSADVNVYGDVNISYIEMINFLKSNYNIKPGSKTLTVDSTFSPMSIFSFREDGFKFNGLRNLLNYGGGEISGKKVINVYLAPSKNIKILEIELGNGNITLSRMGFLADYTVTLTKGNVEADSLSSNSRLTVEVGEGEVRFENCNVPMMLADVGEGRFTYIYNTVNRSFELSAPSGTVYIDGASEGVAFSQFMPITSSKLTATVAYGDIYIFNTIIPDEE